MAPDPSLLSSVKTGIILASSTEKLRLLAVLAAGWNIDGLLQHGMLMCPSSYISATKLEADRLAFFQ